VEPVEGRPQHFQIPPELTESDTIGDLSELVPDAAEEDGIAAAIASRAGYLHELFPDCPAHEVRRGDTLRSIADNVRVIGDPRSHDEIIAAILKLNPGITTASALQPGQRVRLPVGPADAAAAIERLRARPPG
jgi:Tfp pilus assembly protein FimV